MAKKKLAQYVFEPGISKDDNLLPNAVALLTANKEFLKAMVVAFINNQIANNIAPYAGYTYAPQKCTRDMDFVITAIIQDLRYGGNVKIRQIADYFHINGEPMIRGDVSPETTGQAYLRDTINNFIFTNTPVSNLYGQTTVPQIFISGSNAEPSATSRNTSLWAVTIDVITNGPTAMPAKVSGVSSIRLLGNYQHSEILLITDTTNSQILYNFADPANSMTLEYKNGRSSGDNELLSDLDYLSWWKTTDTITTLYLSTNTSNLSFNADIQIFVEEPYQTVKPWDFGTDAIERMRVSTPQAMLDADFEYGLQPTKWQAIGQIRTYPSLFELPGTDIPVRSIITDASVTSGGFGASLITVVTNGTHGLTPGQPITIKGLNSIVNGFARAEGSFLVFRVDSGVTFSYYASARVGNTNGQSLLTSFVQLRQAAYYTGSQIGRPTFSLVSNGTTSLVASKFNTASGEFSFAFTGPAPNAGEPVSGSASIPIGTVVAGVVGSTSITTRVFDTTSISDTSIVLSDVTGIQQNLALENGSNGAVFINSLLGLTLNLSGPIGRVYNGFNGSNAGVSGTNIESIGSSALFNVTVASGVYTVVDPRDSTANGQDYFVGDQITLLGTDLGGASPANNITITVSSVDSGGAIQAFSFTGTGTGTGTFTGISGSNTTMSGAGAQFTVERRSGEYIIANVSVGGTGYRVGNRIRITGNNLSGVTPLNDCIVTVTSANLGAIVTADGDGTVYLGDTITVFPVIQLSEPLTNILPDATPITLGAIAEIQVDFESPHGLIPGTPVSNAITSNPTPQFITNGYPTGLPTSGSWTAIAFGDGVFVALRSSSTATATSTNGQTWISGGAMPSGAAWSSLAFGTISGINIFVAVSTGGTAAAYSTNGGGSWLSSTMPSSGTWSSVTFYEGRFVAVRSGSAASAFSIDGVNWTAGGSLPASTSWTDVVGGIVGTSTYFIAVASGTTTSAYSTDGGVTWTSSSLPSSIDWRSVTYGNSSFFAVARGGTAGAISTNGTTWTAITLPISDNWNHVIYGRENFVIVSDSSTNVLISFTAATGTWTERVGALNGTFEETAFGSFADDVQGSYVSVGTAQNAQQIRLISANHQLAAGPFIVTKVPTPTSLRYIARSQGFINVDEPIVGIVNSRPDAFFVHRPFDGGVQLGTGGPAHGAQAVRQSKKYIRYQSGKGMFFNTGALFAPNYNISGATAAGTAVNSLITFTTDDTDHGFQPGAIVEIQGMVSFEYNGEYTVEDIIDARTFTARSQVVLSTTTAQIGSDCKVILKYWHGSTIRIGTFDDQNGIFYQYDGQRMSVVKRSATNQLTGTVSATTDSNLITGLGTKFADQLIAGDKITLRGMTHIVTSIVNNTSMTVNPDWRGVNSIVGAKIAKIEDEIFYQDEWNIDKLDGTGPSGYNFLPWKMQMIAIQYTWYAVGFIEFHLRGADGKFIFFHRVRNSNVNTEAYMRTANLPVRYEVENTGARSKLKTGINSTASSLLLSDASAFPQTGIVYVDNELISYSGKSGDTLTGVARSATLNAFASGQNRLATAGVAASHTAGTGVILVSNTASPTVSHWGSALLTDGRFDEDRGYLFNFTAYGISASANKQTAFMLRLAPSVSNAIIGDLGERELLNRAQLLLQNIAVSVDSTASNGAIIVEGVLNPRNYPANPTNITWNSLSSQGAGGQPSFAQIALGGSINWGGVPLTTSTATINGPVQLNTTAIGFNVTQQPITAEANPTGASTVTRAFETGRNSFFVATATIDGLTNTPLRVGDTLTATATNPSPPFNSVNILSGQTITSIDRNVNSSGWTRINMSSGPNNSSFINTDVTVTVTSSAAATFYNAFSITRNTYAMTDAEIVSSNITIGDTLISGFIPGNRNVANITRNAFRVGGINYGIITMNANAGQTSGFGSNQTVTVQVPQTASSYAFTNFLFFTLPSWNASTAGVGSRVAPAFTQFPAGTAVSGVNIRTLGTTTVVRATFTQTTNATLNAGGTTTFEFGDVQFALPGEQVFAFVANPGNTVELILDKLKELTTTAIGGRGAFPNGPDVLAINVFKVAGTATPTSIILRWSEAQA
jgi:hypothetical protein